MRPIIFAAFCAVLLSGCAQTPQQQQATTSSVVSKIQSVYAEVKTDTALWLVLHPADAALVTKAEAVLNPEIAALSSASAPTTISGVLTDIQNQVQALPAGVISTATQTDITVAVSLAQTLLTVSKVVYTAPAVLVAPAHHFVRA